MTALGQHLEPLTDCALYGHPAVSGVGCPCGTVAVRPRRRKRRAPVVVVSSSLPEVMRIIAGLLQEAQDDGAARSRAALIARHASNR